MAALPYMQLYIADYLADTAHLTTQEHGAYLLLIFNYWQRGESFKHENQQTLNERLARVARLSENEWNSVKNTLSEFFYVTENEWKHERIDRDLDTVKSNLLQKSKAGKASAAKKSQKKQIIEFGIELNSTGVEQTLNKRSTNKDTDTDNISIKPTTNVVVKKTRKSQKIAIAPTLPDSIVLKNKNLWEAYLVVRKTKRVANTESAIELCIERIERLQREGFTAEQVLKMAIEKGWAGLEYVEKSLKESSNSSNKNKRFNPCDYVGSAKIQQPKNDRNQQDIEISSYSTEFSEI
jgi:uncharacterized protein YdaU (DUF1376 family)